MFFLRFANEFLLLIGYTESAAVGAANMILCRRYNSVSRNDAQPNDELDTAQPASDQSVGDDSEAAENGARANHEGNAVEDVSEQAAEQLDLPDEEQDEENPLTVQLEQAEARAQDYLDNWQRERAAFQNYKRRVERERSEQRRAIAGGVLLKLLPVLDDFQRAMGAVPDAERDTWFEGVTLIQRKLERVLHEEGVTEIEALGQPFDPNLHEAVGIDGDSDAEPDTVTEVLQTGYLHGEQVLRPAMVRVAG
jgi:molecular chaperone GrpE